MKITIKTHIKLEFCISLIVLIFSLGASADDIIDTPADSCQKTCKINADCGVGAVCNGASETSAGVCAFQPLYCANERWSVNSRGEMTECSIYNCDNESGLCRRTATLGEHCTWGYVFDSETSTCKKSINCNLQEPECQKVNEQWKMARAQWEETQPQPVVTPLSCVSCKASSECGAGQMCWSGRCEATAPYCKTTEDGIFSIINDIDKVSCENYTCEKVSGSCLKNCLMDSECSSDKVCVSGECKQKEQSPAYQRKLHKKR